MSWEDTHGAPWATYRSGSGVAARIQAHQFGAIAFGFGPLVFALDAWLRNVRVLRRSHGLFDGFLTMKHSDNGTKVCHPIPVHAIRLRELCKTVALSRSSVYLLLQRDPTFPSGFFVTKRARCWFLADVLAWLHARSADSAT